MVSKTLFLTGGMPRALVLDHLRKVQEEPSVNSIHIVEYDFGYDHHHNHQQQQQQQGMGTPAAESNDEVALLLMDLLHFDSRRWNTIKLTQCRGKMVHRIVEAITASNVRRFIFSPTRNTARASLVALSVGLAFQSSSLLTLSLNDVRIDHSLMDMLCSGLPRNKSIVELSFINCRLDENDATHMVLAGALPHMKSLQHLSFSNCRLEDEQCHDLIVALKNGEDSSSSSNNNNKGGSSLLELSLDGNRCHYLGLQALSSLLMEGSSLLVLDLSGQKLESGCMDLAQLVPGLESSSSRLRCLQLSSNTFDSASIQALSGALMENKTLQILHLAWSRLNDTAMLTLANGLRRNNSLSKLILYGCGIDNQGLSRFANRMRQMKGLKSLDLAGDQQFDSVGLFHFVASLQRNTDLEELMLPANSSSSSSSSSTATSTANDGKSKNDQQRYKEEAHRAIFLCDANRGGRRFLRSKDQAPVALWPLVLCKVQNLEMPNMIEGGGWLSSTSTTTSPLPIVDLSLSTANQEPDDDMSLDEEDGEDPRSISDEEDDSLFCDASTSPRPMKRMKNEDSETRKAGVLYHLVRNLM